VLSTPEQRGEREYRAAYGIALRVDDVQQSMNRLRDRGVNFELPEPYDSGVCHLAFFRDPDGNSLLLHRRYAPYSDGREP